jgi:hypothetical protein
MLKKFQILFIIFHIVILTLINIRGTYNTYLDFFFGVNSFSTKNKLIKLIDDLVYNSKIWCYATFAGINSTYNFYAPNVGSEFLMSFTLFNKNEEIICRRTSPNLKQNESLQRFLLCTMVMQDKLLLKNKDTLTNNYIKVIIKQISKTIKSEIPTCLKIKAFIYLYEFPTSKNYISGDTDKLILIDKYEF